MRIHSIEASNFGSYKTLALDLTEETGLTLIEGATGSGKSTLCDLIPWVLFGKTAKGGSVDEIRSWNSSEPTTGRVVFSLSNDKWEVLRIRGKTNDFAFRREGVQDLSRGKDLTDTQRLLNDLLDMDFELYLSGAYYHEFSQTTQFFTTTAKIRRSICENLVDLSLAIKLQDALRVQRKELDKQLLATESDLRVNKSNLTLLITREEREQTKARDWDRDREHRLHRCAEQFQHFENNRRRVISNACPTCRTKLGEARIIDDTSRNPFNDRLSEIETEKNPYDGEVKSYKEEIHAIHDKIRIAESYMGDCISQLTNLDYLGLAADQYRSQSIGNTIRFVEIQTNEFLSKFFEAELRVLFESTSADKLEVTIFKDGNEASFTQLSKGQRQLLKLCFGASVMQTVQNHHGISLNQLFFDEALDGLDDHKKLMAVRMLETLTREYQSIWLVEHSETVKAMVNDKYHVELVNGESVIGKT